MQVFVETYRDEVSIGCVNQSSVAGLEMLTVKLTFFLSLVIDYRLTRRLVLTEFDAGQPIGSTQRIQIKPFVRRKKSFAGIQMTFECSRFISGRNDLDDNAEVQCQQRDPAPPKEYHRCSCSDFSLEAHQVCQMSRFLQMGGKKTLPCFTRWRSKHI